MDDEQYEAWKDLIEDNAKFTVAANKVIKAGGSKRGVKYRFICPLCGGDAAIVASTYNGHRHAWCNKCDMGYME